MTYPYVYGMDKSLNKLSELYDECRTIVMKYCGENDFMINYINYLYHRTK